MSNYKDFKNKNTEFTGTTGIDLPEGGTAARVNEQGRLRFNTDTSLSEYYTGSEWVALSASVKWQSTAKTADFTASSKEGYFVDTNSATVVATLPASPSVGDEIIFVDLRGTFGTNKFTVNPNGLNIKGQTNNQDIEEDYASIRIVYSGATYGWVVVSSNAVTEIPLKFAYNIDYLVIAGGGGGGGDNGGGGGAGGYRTATSYQVVGGTTYAITVGGGASGVSGHGAGTQASNSSFGSITSSGGGGGSSQSFNGGSGGSGGGAGQNDASSAGQGGSGNQGSYTPVEGYAGGNSNATVSVGGGGGGSSQAGQAGTTGSGGNGGNGTSSSITGSAVTRAGGGGGGADQNSSGGGSAGSGGASAGGTGSSNGSNATANTGSGAGGGGQSGGAIGGAGGSGIVILRIPTASYSGTTTGSPTVADDGSFKVLTYTGNGSYTA